MYLVQILKKEVLKKLKFCEKLKLLRIEREMNQTEFAKFLGTSKQVISRYEKGENTPKITTVLEYATKLGVPLSYFTNDDIETIEHLKKTDIESKDVPIEQEETLEKIQLNEGEEMLLDLFRRVPVESQQMVLDMIKIALKQNQ